MTISFFKLNLNSLMIYININIYINLYYSKYTRHIYHPDNFHLFEKIKILFYILTHKIHSYIYHVELIKLKA
jgi:hypothetical protein